MTNDSKELKTLLSSYQSDFPVKIFFDNVSTSNEDNLNKNLSIAEKNEFLSLLTQFNIDNLEHFEISNTNNTNINLKWINFLISKLKYLFIIFLLNLLPLSYITYKNHKEYNKNLNDLNLILNKNKDANQSDNNDIHIEDKINSFISFQRTKKIANFITNFDTILLRLIENSINYEIMFIELNKERINVKIKIKNYNLSKLNDLIKEKFLRFETETKDQSLFHIKIFIND